LKERRTRTCFVGNLPLEFDQNDLRKIFKECGTVEKIWFRSVPTILDSKLPLKAKIIKKELGQ
jgi:RNA recognition motif-containing protein